MGNYAKMRIFLPPHELGGGLLAERPPRFSQCPALLFSVSWSHLCTRRLANIGKQICMQAKVDYNEARERREPFFPWFSKEKKASS